MTENDYIAEYIKEKRPEIIETPSFYMWRLGKSLSNIVNVVIDSFRKIDWSKVDWSKVDLSEIEKEEQYNDVQGDEAEDGINTKTGG